MNTYTKKQRRIWALPVILAVMISAAPLNIVHAAPPAEEGRNLEALYQRELELLGSQEERLQKAAEAASRVEEYIAEQRAKDADTSEAEGALNVFESALAEAGSHHDEASAILNTHAGFDQGGKVTDLSQALETVRSAGQAQRQVHQILVQALTDLRTTLRDAHSYSGMEDAFQKSLEIQQAQGEHLIEGENIISRMEAFIVEQKDLGFDTAGLESALQDFETAYDSAQANHNEAAQAIDNTIGFDESGKVTDPAQARITLSTAGAAQRQFHLTASEARIDLRNAVQEYRSDVEEPGV